MNGFLLIDKPKGITSFTLCNIIRKKLSLKKVGHTGTLDPNATGLMILGLDDATKTLKLFEYDDKTYLASIIFGYETDSYDICGNIINEKEMNFSFDTLKEKIEILKNQEEQIPPKVSSIKKDGKKLYQYKDDINLEEFKRKVKLFDYEIIDFNKNDDNLFELKIKLHVSKGYYIRSFANDLGHLLDGFATLKELRRIKIGNFDINNTISLDDVTNNDIKPIFDILDLPKVYINNSFKKYILNGITLDERQTNLHEPFYVCDDSNIIAIYEEYDLNKYKPIIIFR